MDFNKEKLIAESAWKFLRSNTTATIKFGEHTRDISYAISKTGELIIPAMVAMLQPCDTVMFVPDYSEGCMEMHVSLRQFIANGDDGLLADRWNVYHGDSPEVQWASVTIDAARFHEMFIDGESLCRENILAEIEGALCKELNAKCKEKVRALCVAKTLVNVEDPVVVGVDQFGIDIRAAFGIVRVPADAVLTSANDVHAMLAD
jgi:hypothetical protein